MVDHSRFIERRNAVCACVWSARQLIFGVDSRDLCHLSHAVLPALSSSNSSSSSSSDNLIDSPSAFKDMQYALIWDQTTQSILGINLLLIFVRLMSLRRLAAASDIQSVSVHSKQHCILSNHLLWHVDGLCSRNNGTAGPAADGFQTFSGAFINLQRAANGELSILKIVEPRASRRPATNARSLGPCTTPYI